MGIAGAISFVANGVSVIEKHITFSKNMYGSDAKHSMEPEQFKQFAKEIKDAFIIYESKVDKNNIKPFFNMRKIFQKSIYAKKNLKKGDKINLSNLSFKKPDNGISASEYKKILGKKVLREIKKDYKFSLKDFK